MQGDGTSDARGTQGDTGAPARIPLTRRELRRLREQGAVPEANNGANLIPNATTPAPPVDSRPAAADTFSLSGMFASAASPVSDAVSAQRPNILVVCTGNICRSPLAEILLRERLADLDVRIHSAGTHALVGRGMPDPAQKLGVALGASPAMLAEHRGRLLTERMLDEADLVLTMTAEQSTHAAELAPSALLKVFPVRVFARLSATLTAAQVVSSSQGASGADRLRSVARAVSGRRAAAPPAPADEDVVDPYRRPAEVYAQAGEQLAPALDEVVRVIRATLN